MLQEIIGSGVRLALRHNGRGNRRANTEDIGSVGNFNTICLALIIAFLIHSLCIEGDNSSEITYTVVNVHDGIHSLLS